MKLQCCFCKHICCNHEWDEMLDCELSLEEEGKPKCYQSTVNPFYLFELETDEKVCKSYLKSYNEEYGLYERISNNISNDIPFENFMSSAKEEWNETPFEDKE